MSEYWEVMVFQDKREYPPWMQKLGDRGYPALQPSIFDMSWRPDSGQIAVACLDHAIRIWSLDGSTDVPHQGIQVDYVSWPVSVAWSPRTNPIAAGDTDVDQVRLWDIESGKQLKSYFVEGDWPLSIDWSPLGRYLISASRFGVVSLWDSLSTETHPQIISAGERISYLTVRWCPRMNRVALFSPRMSVTTYHSKTKSFRNDPDSEVYILDSRTWQVTNVLTSDMYPVALGQLIDWSPSGQYLAVLGEGATVHLWEIGQPDTRKMAVLQPIEPPCHDSQHGPFHCVSWNSDGRRIACVVGTEIVYLWEDGVPQPSLCGDEECEFHSVQWSPDGKYLAVGDMDGIVRVFSKETSI